MTGSPLAGQSSMTKIKSSCASFHFTGKYPFHFVTARMHMATHNIDKKQKHRTVVLPKYIFNSQSLRVLSGNIQYGQAFRFLLHMQFEVK